LTLLRSREISKAALPAVLLLTILGHSILAIAYVPVNSDLTVYRRYAEAVDQQLKQGGSFSEAHDQDIRERALREGLPEPTSSELLVEYPPLAVLAMAAIAVGLDLESESDQVSDAFNLRYRLALFAVDMALLAALTLWAARIPANGLPRGRPDAGRLAVYGACGLVLGNLIFDRLDLIVGALLIPSAIMLVRGRWLASFALLAVAINFKASPLALAPLWVLASVAPGVYAEARRRPLPLLNAVAVRSLVLAGFAALLFAPFLVSEGSRAFDFLQFRAIQGVQIESIPATILLVLHALGLPLDVVSTLGAYELDTPLSAVVGAASPALILVAACATAAVFIRGSTTVAVEGANAPGSARTRTSRVRSLAAADPTRFLVAVLTTLLLTLVTSKVLSPQYLFWLLPLVTLVQVGPVRGWTFLGGFLVMCAFTTAIFPYLYGRTLVRRDPDGDGFLDPTPLGVSLLIVRNAALIWLAWLALRSLWRSNPEAGQRGEAA